MFESVTRVRRLEFHPISFPGAFGSGELKTSVFRAFYEKQMRQAVFFVIFYFPTNR